MSKRTPTLPVGFFFGAPRLYIRCLPTLLVLSLIEASCRAVQLGAFGDIHVALYGALETLVWLARVGIVFVIAGEGNIFRSLAGFRALQASIPKKALQWVPKLPSLTVQIVLYTLFALALNFLIGQLGNLIADQAYADFLTDHEPITFFFKNMTVIPFTIVFAYQIYRFVITDAKRRG